MYQRTIHIESYSVDQSEPVAVPYQAVSIVFFTDSWRPDSFYDYIKVGLRYRL